MDDYGSKKARTFYDMLGVGMFAPPETVEAAYREKVRHLTKRAREGEADSDRDLQILEKFHYLISEDKRGEYLKWIIHRNHSHPRRKKIRRGYY